MLGCGSADDRLGCEELVGRCPYELIVLRSTKPGFGDENTEDGTQDVAVDRAGMIVSITVVVTMSTSIKADVVWTVIRDIVCTKLANGLSTSNGMPRRSTDLNVGKTLKEDLSKHEHHLCADVITPVVYIG